MPHRLTSLRSHQWLATLAVLAFALRALIPAGFMPGGDGTFSLRLCPDGLPAAFAELSGGHSPHAGHHHHHVDSAVSPEAAAADSSSGAPAHDHQSWQSAHCAFSAVASAPPLSFAPIVGARAETTKRLVSVEAAPVSLDVRFRIAQPRAPPRLV